MANQNITAEKIQEKFQAWNSAYNDNNNRGEVGAAFVFAGEQWDSGVPEDRLSKNKESLTLNQAKKYQDKFISQMKQLEFELNVFPMQNNLATEELATFRMLFKSSLMSRKTKDAFSKAIENCASFGYAFAEVNFCRDDNETLNSSPCINIYNDQTIAFWDLQAQSPTKIDGRYCGLRNKVSKGTLVSKYPKLANRQYIHDENIVIDYWYREEEPAQYIKLKSGVYKRTDLLTAEDKKNVFYDDKQQTDVKDGTKPCIYFMRTCNNKVILKPEEFPTDDLPLVYHPALTYYLHKKWMTFPYTYALQGAQKLHNYIYSQIATISKSCAGQKIILSPSHIQNEEQKFYAQNFLGIEGAVILGQEPGQREIQVINSPELPASLLQFAPQTSQEMDQISGASMDSQMSDQAVVSGKALSLITHNMTVINTGIISSHILFINDVCKLMKQMLPRVITEERTMLLKVDDSTTEAVTVNEHLPSGLIKNNIKDVANIFQYEIDCGPTTEMQRENTMKSLEFIYNAPFQNPDYQITKDILIRNLPIPDSAEIEKRLRTTIDPMIIKYGQGKISEDEFMAYQKQAKQQAMQQQMQMRMQDPIAKAEDNKASAMQYDAETKRMSAASKAATDNAKVNVDMVKVAGSSQLQEAQHAIDVSRLQLEQNAEQRAGDQQQHDQMIAQQQTALQANQQQQQFMQGQRNEAIEKRDEKEEYESMGISNANP